MTQWHFFSTCLYHFIYEPSSDVQNEFILALLFTSVKVVLSSSLLYSFSLHADYLIALNLLLYANILWLHEFKPKSTLSWSQVIKYIRNGFMQSEMENSNLLRLEIPIEQGVYPMISGHKSRFALRFMSFETNKNCEKDIEFTLAVC